MIPRRPPVLIQDPPRWNRLALLVTRAAARATLGGGPGQPGCGLAEQRRLSRRLRAVRPPRRSTPVPGTTKIAHFGNEMICVCSPSCVRVPIFPDFGHHGGAPIHGGSSVRPGHLTLFHQLAGFPTVQSVANSRSTVISPEPLTTLMLESMLMLSRPRARSTRSWSTRAHEKRTEGA